MCQLLGMNSNKPAAISFSLEGFSRRGGLTGEHSDGWGIGYFDEHGSRLLFDERPSATSELIRVIQRNPIKSGNVIVHIRKATRGPISMHNCHPFMRDLWGSHWVFAHNGDLKEFAPQLSDRFRPVGDTDSELAFCLVMQSLRRRFGDVRPDQETLQAALQEIASEVATHGTFNFLLSDGEFLFAHCSTQLHYVQRAYPFSSACLVDCDRQIDFSAHNHQDDRMTVIATTPLTTGENWQAFAAGELKVFRDGN